LDTKVLQCMRKATADSGGNRQILDGVNQK